MSLEELVSKYICATETVLDNIERADASVKIELDMVEAIVQTARDYVADAKYYRDSKRFEVSLTSIAYSEGLLDALRLLGTVKFEWPKGHRNRKQKRS